MKLAASRDLWLRALNGEGRSQLTIRSYTSILTIFERYLASSGHPLDIEEVTQFHLHDFLASLRAAGKARHTVDNYYGAIASWMAWTTTQDFRTVNPATKMRYRRGKPAPPRAVPMRDVYAAVQGMKRTRYSGIDSRDRMAVMLMAFTGARISEACAMRWEHVKWDRNIVEIPQTKGGTATIRWVPLHQRLRDELTRHRGVVALLWPNCPWILQTREGRRADETWIQHGFARRGFAFTPHQLRHTYATQLARAGVDLVRVRHFMGHASLDMTARYVASLLSDNVDQVASDLRSAFESEPVTIVGATMPLERMVMHLAVPRGDKTACGATSSRRWLYGSQWEFSTDGNVLTTSRALTSPSAVVCEECVQVVKRRRSELGL